VEARFSFDNRLELTKELVKLLFWRWPKPIGDLAQNLDRARATTTEPLCTARQNRCVRLATKIDQP
jgi:hypothetical protein